MSSTFLPGRSGRCTFTLPLQLTNVSVQPAPHATTMPRRAKASKTAKGPKKTNPLPTPAPINAPWTSVHDTNGNPIPYLQQTTVANVTVRKNAQSASNTKTVRFLLLTHSDGGRVIEDNSGFTEPQYCLPGHPRYLGLMCQLGEALAAKLGISSGGNKPGDDATWDVLVQLPLKYNAYYKTRSGGEHLDLYIAGHDFQKFDSVKQYAIHLAWLAKEEEEDDDDGGKNVVCECKVCREERRKVPLGKQVERKIRWAEHSGPVMQGVPDWRA